MARPFAWSRLWRRPRLSAILRRVTIRSRAPVRAALGAALLVGLAPVEPPGSGAPSGPPAFRVLLRDGSWVEGRFRELDTADGTVTLDGRELRLSDVVSLSGPAPAEAVGGVELQLVGGDVLRGEVVGGDEAGETIVVRSPVLGEVPVYVDRVARLVFLDRVAAGQNADFSIPDDVDEGEGLFVPARRGFDLIVGAVHRFGPEGVLFEARGDASPRLRPYGEVAGFALRDGEEPERESAWRLVTAAGDRVGVDWIGGSEQELTFVLESGAEVRIPSGQLAALTPLGTDIRFVSDLEPVGVEERSSFGGDGEVLRPYRADRSVVDGPLCASGQGFGKGIGVHARSVLTFAAPAGVTALVGVVALDDSVLGLPVRGVVDVQVRVDGARSFERAGLAAGTAPVALGRIPVRPGMKVELVVDFGPGLDLGDRVDWLAVAFVP
jgi:hypothetical protein